MGNSNNIAYKWSVSQDFTPTCLNNGCDIDLTSTTSTLTVGRPHLQSYYAGNYTCEVSETGRPHNTNNNADFSVTVVGEFSPLPVYIPII